MNKKQFIQAQVIHHDPASPLEVRDRVNKAEKVYDTLTQLGYGTPKQDKARETRNYYKELTPYQKEWFDKFWPAFAHPHGKQRAAWAWIKLGELSVNEYKNIVIAAKAEAMRPVPHGQSRKMAEGWLTEFRFEDHTVSQRNRADEENQTRKRQLNSELNGLKMFVKSNPDQAETQQPRIDQIKIELEQLK